MLETDECGGEQYEVINTYGRDQGGDPRCSQTCEGMEDLCNLYGVHSSSIGILRVVKYGIRKGNPRRSRRHSLDQQGS